METHRLYFLSNSCHVCKISNPHVSCALCGLVFYCTKEHRRLDWKSHSIFCRAVNIFCNQNKRDRLFDNLVGLSAEEFRDFRHHIANQVCKVVQRPLESWELEMIYYPKVCRVCLRSDVKSVCHDCGITYTCSEKHYPKNHRDFCKHLKMYCNIIKEFSLKGIEKVEMPRNIKQLPTSIQELLNSKNSDVRDVLLSELLTYPLTVANGLKELGLSELQQLSLHFVGAEWQFEVSPLEKWEFLLLHLLPNCQSLNLTFIGPELTVPGNVNFPKLCKECDKNRKLNFNFEPLKLYHDFMKNHTKSKPHLVLALNSGLYRANAFEGKDSWGETLKLMYSLATPILITEYTEKETSLDRKRFQKMFPKFKTIIAGKMNPFSSQKPSLNIISDDETPVVFKNYFWTILSA